MEKATTTTTINSRSKKKKKDIPSNKGILLFRE
jgi:hypothetical protein